MKIAILRGYPRLIDGESTYVEELVKWGNRNDVDFMTYYYHAPSKKPVVYDDGYQHEYRIFTIDSIEETLKELNSYDAVLLINPARTIRMTTEHVLAFHEMYKRIETKKVFQQHTNFIRSHTLTPYLWSYINESDLIYTHSLNSNFIQHAYKLPSKKNRCKLLKTGIDINELNRQSKESSIVRDPHKVTYCGRFVGYKGPVLLMNFGDELSKNNFKPSVYGMDSSLGCRLAVLEHRNCNNLLFPNRPKCENPVVDVYGRISREEVLKKYRESMFSWCCVSFRNNDQNKKAFENRLEYSTIESIANGSIPILEKVWAETNFTYDGIRFSEIENFAILYDKENPQTTIDKMLEVANNPELQQAYRETGLKVISSQYDINKVTSQIIKDISEIDIDKDKIKDDIELVRFITENDKLTDYYIKQKEENKIVPLHQNSTTKNQLGIFSGKAIKRILAEEI